MSAQGPQNGEHWPILADCPAPWHNTLRAARGAAGNRAHSPCVCPGAVDILAAYRLRERTRYVGQQKSGGGTKPQLGRPKKVEQAPKASWPNLLRGACVKPEGRLIMDQLMSRPASGTTKAARDLCSRCPVRRECREWARTQEKPVGSWAGMYGGLTASERRHRFFRGSPAVAAILAAGVTAVILACAAPSPGSTPVCRSGPDGRPTPVPCQIETPRR